ncbi:hypothetical protein PAPYR_10747 [Paratrimastix pyriformis]|uniref:Uncharacterized protein n=1 Tax=Paratrimastix pyriformis TaxID=342808 RepID=A0ABQ8U596_9EUKA|nr:hypothetical protein PAPYR_10747 [Paratrimastix pyriformis]
MFLAFMVISLVVVLACFQFRKKGQLKDGETLAEHLWPPTVQQQPPTVQQQPVQQQPAVQQQAPPSIRLRDIIGEYDPKRLQIIRSKKVSLDFLRGLPANPGRKKPPSPRGIRFRQTLARDVKNIEFAIKCVMAVRRYRRKALLPWGRTAATIEAAKELLVEEGGESLPPHPGATTIRLNDLIMDNLQTTKYYALIGGGFCCVLTDSGTYIARQTMRTGFMVTELMFTEPDLAKAATLCLDQMTSGQIPTPPKLPTPPRDDRKEDEEVTENIPNVQAYPRVQTWSAEARFTHRDDAGTITEGVAKVLEPVGRHGVLWGMSLLNSREEKDEAKCIWPEADKGVIPMLLELMSNTIRRDPTLHELLKAKWGCEMPNGVDSRFNLYIDTDEFLISRGPPSHPTVDLTNNRLRDALPILKAYQRDCDDAETRRVEEQKERKRKKGKATAAKPTAAKPTAAKPAATSPYHLRARQPATPPEPEEGTEQTRQPRRKEDTSRKDLQILITQFQKPQVVIRMLVFLEATQRLRRDIIWSMSSQNRRQKICEAAAGVLLAGHEEKFQRYLNPPYVLAALCDRRECKDVAKQLYQNRDIWWQYAAQALGMDTAVFCSNLEQCQHQHPVHQLLRSPVWPNMLLALSQGKPLATFPALECVLHAIYDCMPVSNVESEKAVQTLKNLDQRQLRGETPQVLFRFLRNVDLPVTAWEWRKARRDYLAKVRRQREAATERHSSLLDPSQHILSPSATTTFGADRPQRIPVSSPSSGRVLPSITTAPLLRLPIPPNLAARVVAAQTVSGLAREATSTWAAEVMPKKETIQQKILQEND